MAIDTEAKRRLVLRGYSGITSAAGVTEPLTGVSSTSAVGTAGIAVTIALTGVLSTGSVGTLSPEATVSISGNQSTAQVGAISPDRTISISGVQANSAAGSVDYTKSGSAGLTGVGSTGSVGTVTASAGASAALTGVQSNSASGSVGFEESGTVGLTGVESTGLVGTVGFTKSGSLDLSGVEATAATGDVTAAAGATQAVTGVESVGSVGSVDYTKSGTLSLTGVESTASVGNVSISVPTFQTWLANANKAVDGQMIKNTASQTMTALLLDSIGVAVITGTTTVYITGDAGTQASAGTATHEGNGEWSFLPSQANTNYDEIGATWINTGAITVHQTIYTTGLIEVGTDDKVILSNNAHTGATIPNVTTVDTTSANTDMRGTDGANTVAPLDAAGIRTAIGLAIANIDTQLGDIPTVSEFNARTLLAASYFDPAVDPVANVTLVATTATNTDMRGTDGANTIAPDNATISDIAGYLDTEIAQIISDIAALNNISVAEIFNEPLTKAIYNVGQSLGKIIREISTWGAAEGAVIGTPTTTSVQTNITGFDDNFFRDQNFTPYNGASQAGQGRIVSTYNGTTGVFTFDEPFTTALIAGDDVLINSQHVHRITEIVTALLTTQMTESYAADGIAPNLTQAIFLIQQMLGDFSISGNTITTKQLDGTTTAATHTLDDAVNPTSRTRTT